MFAISRIPLHEHPLRTEAVPTSAGAVVEFEGRVRDTNDGRSVIRLEYEAADDLAAAAFHALAEETRQRFAIVDLRCIHRAGVLTVGEAAVWIAVYAPHRGPAFAACRYLIDELKKRLPIWKKEFYTDGEADWINAP